MTLGAVAYAALVIAASAHPGPRGWGVHAAAFLPLPLRIAILAALLGSVVLLAFRAPGAPEGPRMPEKKRPDVRYLALLIPYAACLWLLRARTQLLGDGQVWLATVRSGERRAYSEPLSAALWHGFGDLVRLFGFTPDALSMSIFSVLCGVLAAPVLAGIAMEIAPAKGRWTMPLVLLLTLGISQLFFGYIESYPAAAVFILLYLWLALRFARGAASPYVVAAALALAAAAHLSALYLVPSYLLLVVLAERPPVVKAALLVLPFALLAGLLLALGYPPSQWTDPLRAATSGIREGFQAATLRRPYGWISYGHFADVMNAVLLAMPVPFLLLLGWTAATRARFRPFPRALAVLGAAAAPGFLLAVWLTTPVAPAQDWDLNAMLLLPAAVFGIAAGARLLEGGPARARLALAGLSATSLLAFVAVNASEEASVARLTAISSDSARVSRYGRAYISSALELHFRDRGQPARALPYARATLAAEPTNPRHWTNVGNELMSLGRYDEAIPYLNEAARRGPGRWQGQYDLGICYMNLGRYSEATPCLREAVRLEGNLPALRHHLGIALYRSGHADSAVVVWQEILARWPGYASSLQIPSR